MIAGRQALPAGVFNVDAVGHNALTVQVGEEVRAAHNSKELVGASPALSEVMKMVKCVAGTDSTVLVTGETGTGKELIARLIHALSGRKDKALVKLDCTTIPANLAESELGVANEDLDGTPDNRLQS